VAGCAPAGPKPSREIVNLELHSAAAVGTGPYVLALNLSQMLEELHPWLRASVVECLNFADAVHSSDALSPERRKYAFPPTMATMEVVAAWQGKPPYKRKFTDLKYLGLCNLPGFTFITYNPDIRTPQDLIGKTIALNIRGTPVTTLGEITLEHGWGIYDKVRLSYHLPMSHKDVLLTGVADAVFSGQATPIKGGEFEVFPYCLQIIGARKTYWLDITEEDVARIDEKTPWKATRLVLPKGALGPDVPPEDVGLLVMVVAFLIWEDTPEEIAYELVKLLAENGEEWSRRGGGMETSAEYMASLPGLTEDMLHPGALRYYKEHDIKIE